MARAATPRMGWNRSLWGPGGFGDHDATTISAAPKATPRCNDDSPLQSAGATLHIVARVACPLTGRVDDAPPSPVEGSTWVRDVARTESVARAPYGCHRLPPTDRHRGSAASIFHSPPERRVRGPGLAWTQGKGAPHHCAAARWTPTRRFATPPYQGVRGHLALKTATRAGAKRLCTPCHRCECKHGLYARSVSHVDLPLFAPQHHLPRGERAKTAVGSRAHLQN
jgi:hypothetical protein